MAEKKQPSVEEQLARLDEIIEQLEGEETTLTDSLKIYGEGVELIKNCEELLDGVEKQIIELTKEPQDEE